MASIPTSQPKDSVPSLSPLKRSASFTVDPQVPSVGPSDQISAANNSSISIAAGLSGTPKKQKFQNVDLTSSSPLEDSASNLQADVQRPTKRRSVKKKHKPKFTQFNIIPSILQYTRNVTSKFLATKENERLNGFVENSRKSGYDGEVGSKLHADNEEKMNGMDEKTIKHDPAKIIVIHFGSQSLRLGKSSDAVPVSVPHVIARKVRSPNTPLVNKTNLNVNGRANEEKEKEDLRTEELMEDLWVMDHKQEKSDAAAAKVDMELDFKNRMRVESRRVVPNAQSLVESFNSSSTREIIPDHNDPFHIEWTQVDANDPSSPEYLVGREATQIPSLSRSPPQDGSYYYHLLRPIVHGTINTKDYNNISQWISDIEIIWSEALRGELGVEQREWKSYSVVLVIPDLFDRKMIKEIIFMLLNSMGFREVLIGQESVCATFGAGLSIATVVDIGAQKTSISLVEMGECTDSVVIPCGGDDITRNLLELLKESNFPHELDIYKKPWDWKLMEQLKESICTLVPADINVHICNFFVRDPTHPTYKYEIKVYNEIYKAPLSVFYKPLLDFPRKLLSLKQNSAYQEKSIENVYANPPSAFDLLSSQNDKAKELYNATITTRLIQMEQFKKGHVEPIEWAYVGPNDVAKVDTETGKEDIGNGESEQTEVKNPQDESYPPQAHTAATEAVPLTTLADTSVSQTKEEIFSSFPKSSPVRPSLPPSLTEFTESTIMNIHEAIHFLIGQTKTEERMKKLYSSVLLVGGGGMVSGFGGKCLEPKLQSTLPPTLSTHQVRVLPPPREIDPRILVWKGASILSKLDISNAMWITKEEWNILEGDAVGMKSLVNWSS